MIKRGIKNYFVSLKYVFTPLGAFALGIVLGLSIFVPCVISAVSALCDDVVEIVGAVEVDFDSMWAYIVSAVRALDWSNPLEALNTVFTEKWLTDTLNGCLDKLLGGKTAVEAQIAEAVSVCLSSVLRGAIAFAAFSVLGLVGGFWFTKWIIRRNIAKRGIWKFVLMTLADAVLSAALIVITAWLAAMWWASAFISAVATVLLVGAFALVEAYFVHGRNKVPFKQVVNFKNLFKLLLTNVIVFSIAFIITIVLVAFNAVAGIFIGVAFIAIAFIVTGLNAESYVKAIAVEAAEANEEVDKKVAA